MKFVDLLMTKEPNDTYRVNFVYDMGPTFRGYAALMTEQWEIDHTWGAEPERAPHWLWQRPTSRGMFVYIGVCLSTAVSWLLAKYKRKPWSVNRYLVMTSSSRSRWSWKDPLRRRAVQLHSRLLWRALCVLLVTNVYEYKPRISATKAARSQRCHRQRFTVFALIKNCKKSVSIWLRVAFVASWMFPRTRLFDK